MQQNAFFFNINEDLHLPQLLVHIFWCCSTNDSQTYRYIYVCVCVCVGGCVKSSLTPRLTLSACFSKFRQCFYSLPTWPCVGVALSLSLSPSLSFSPPLLWDYWSQSISIVNWSPSHCLLLFPAAHMTWQPATAGIFVSASDLMKTCDPCVDNFTLKAPPHLDALQ